MAAKTLIGVSSGVVGEKIVIRSNYCEALQVAGAIPVVFPYARSLEEATEMLKKVDGLLMSGGEDINPSYYGETPNQETLRINSSRDTSEMYLLQAADKLGIPILGICRGEQIINVFYGGSLIQDIPSQVGEKVIHRQNQPGQEATHYIEIAEGTQLSALIQQKTVLVNSRHHQSVSKIAPGFRVAALAADGVIEAIETTSTDRFILCIQSHPEDFVAVGDKTFLPVFQEFIRASSEWAKKQHIIQ